jgi:hypothetical protein
MEYFIIIVIIWVYYIYLMHPTFGSHQYGELRSKYKTGDIILFHGLDNINPIFIGTYYGHIGIVFIDPDEPNSRPKIFEAFNTSTMPFFPRKCSKGIALSDLEHRLNSYRGYSFYKELVSPIDASIQRGFKEFISYALDNMYYNESVIVNGINKLLLNETLRNGTNCGELVYLSLIKLGVIPRDELFNNRKHHLAWLAGIKHLANNGYKKPVYVLANYFKL